MRLIVSFNGRGLTINFENIEVIDDFDDYIKLRGTHMIIIVNGSEICSTGLVVIQKEWLVTTDEVFFDTRIEKEDDHGKNSTSYI